MLARPRRRLEIVLGLIWLVDAGLQFQPYMFTPAFVTLTVEPAAAGTPGWVGWPSREAAHLMLAHLRIDNTLFSLTQAFIAVAILHRPLLKVGLAVSFVWAVGIWWLAEGLGGITTGASPITGAPGAAILYALLAVLLWPRRAVTVASKPDSVAARGPIGRPASTALWIALWAGLAVLAVQSANRGPQSLHDIFTGLAYGEPLWIRSVDGHLAAVTAGHGTLISCALAAVFALIALSVLTPLTTRPAVVLAVLIATAVWIGEDFGAVLTGTATDVNTGPLLILLAATDWPVSPPHPGRLAPA